MNTKTIYDMTLASRDDLVSEVSVQKFVPINAETARCVLSYAGQPTKHDLDVAVASTFQGKDGANTVRVAEESARVIDHSAGRVLVDVVLKHNLIQVPYSAEQASNLTCVTANVFMDDEQVVWQLRGEEGNQVLVQTASEDLKEVLQSRRSLQTTLDTASVAHQLETATNRGDFIVVYDSEKEEMVGALVVASGIASTLDEGTLIEFAPAEVAVATALPDDAVAALRPFDPALAAAGSSQARDALKEYLGYMKEYYKSFPEYFEQVKAAVEKFFASRGVRV